jgi:archaellum biogenesis ATPase FlaH/5S rRNA maturation endonuclease (ribonuclease M5)
MKKDEDGNEFYDAYCWSCGQAFDSTHVHNSSHAETLGVAGGVVINKPSIAFAPKVEALTTEQIIKLKELVGFSDKPYRCISPETLRFFGHMVKRNNNGVATEVYYPETEDDKVTGFKIRILPKRFSKVGRTGRGSQLSGQFRYKSAGKRVLIVGGENDKCAAYQALTKYGVHVVSPTTGEASAAKQCAAQYEWLDQYEEIYLGLDNDDKGKEAIEAVCKVLPANKVKIVRWSDKDPHKLLEDGKDEQIRRDFFNAKDFLDTGIKSSTEILDDVKEVLTADIITLPPYMHRMQTMMKRAFSHNGRVVNLLGSTSCGKSTHINNMIYHWCFAEKMKPLIISLEMTAGEYAVDLLSLHLQKNLDWFKDGMDAWDYLQREDVRAMYDNLFMDENYEERFRIVDDREGTVDSIKKLIERGVKQYGCNIVIIDVLTDILRFLPMDEQEKFMSWEKNFVKSGVSIVNVLHTKKPERDKEGKQRKTTEYDALGSGTFVQSAHINIVINRDKMASCPIEKNVTHVDMPKCRRGTTGEAGKWYYDAETRQVYDYDDFFSNPRQENPNYTQDFTPPVEMDYNTGEIYEGNDDVVTSNF